MQMKRCVILSAAPVEDYAFLAGEIGAEDYLICADAGMLHAQKISRKPDLSVGDFDSMPYSDFKDIEIIRHPPEKDDTDTLLAVREGLRRGFRDFLLLAATGGRLDHSFANLMTLDYINRNGARGIIRDEKNTVLFLRNSCVSLQPKQGCKFSVFPWGGEAKGVTIKNAAYPLENFTLRSDYPLGVSNEFLAQPAEISVKDGALLLCISRD